MKVTSIDNNTYAYAHPQKKENVAFKSVGMSLLGITGALMQGIENEGYFLSFLIQDGLGMTLPRVITGFHRDKEITGEYNIKEGIEVLGREGLTGPFMISVAPLMLFLMGTFCKTTRTNTKLIKVIGENLKSMVKDPNFDKSLLSNKEALQKEFYKYNIEKFYKETVPNDKKSDETVKYIMDEFEKFRTSKNKKQREEYYKNILNKINDKIVATSSDLDGICKLTTTSNGEKKTFAAGDVLKAVNHYGIDAIERNKYYSEIDEVAAENIKNNFASKRLLFNVGTVAATLGGLSVLPKIYAYNKVAPGAVQLVKKVEEQKKQTTGEISDGKTQEQQVAFKAKGINSEGILSRIGKFLNKKVPAWVQQEFEYNDYNFTPSLMACLSLFGLLLPRGLRAYNRAYVDENGKRDMSEIHEILLRDSISSLAVVYTVPILTKLLVNSYENKRGFVLTNRASKDKSGWKKFLDVINPYSDLKVLTNTELEALYGNIDSKQKLLNFSNFIDKKGGDLSKIFAKSKNVNEVFNEKTFTLESKKGLSKSEINKEIISLFEKMEDNQKTNDLIKKLMKDSGEIKQGTITRIARGLNSVPGAIVTLLISPIILGVFIPMLTYANTRKSHAKMVNDSKNNRVQQG